MVRDSSAINQLAHFHSVVYGLLGRNGVVGGEDEPLAIGVDPGVGHAVVVFVGLAFSLAYFVVRAGDDGDIAADTNPLFHYFSNIDLGIRVTGVRDVAGLAVGAAVLHGDDEVFGEQGTHGGDVALPVSVAPRFFGCGDFGGPVGLLFAERE